MRVCPSCGATCVRDAWICGACGWQAPARGRVHLVTGSDTGAEGFSADFFARLAAVEERHFWFRGRNALIAWAMDQYFPDARTLLDAGAGTGQVVRALRAHRPTLRCTMAEAFVEGLEIAARMTPDVELVRADVRRLPWNEAFDVVGAFDVLEHVVEDAEAVRQLARCARPGGGVIVTVPQHAWLWGPIDDHSGHVRRYSRRLLVETLQAAGLHIEYVTSFVSCLLPAMLASRRASQAKPADPMAEFRISTAVNLAGGAGMWMDRLLIQAGLSLPAGGSLLAVARRPA